MSNPKTANKNTYSRRREISSLNKNVSDEFQP